MPSDFVREDVPQVTGPVDYTISSPRPNVEYPSPPAAWVAGYRRRWSYYPSQPESSHALLYIRIDRFATSLDATNYVDTTSRSTAQSRRIGAARSDNVPFPVPGIPGASGFKTPGTYGFSYDILFARRDLEAALSLTGLEAIVSEATAVQLAQAQYARLP